jgi:hypothetical protein
MLSTLRRQNTEQPDIKTDDKVEKPLGFQLLELSGTARFNVHKFYVLPTQCVYAFCVDLRTNSDYFPIQH